MTRVLPVVLMILTLCAGAAAMIPADLQTMRQCGIGALSGDGTALVYTVTEHDPDAGRRTTAHLMNLETGEQQVLFAPEDQAGGFLFSPDGTRMIFTRATEDGTEIWLMAADGTERRRLAGPGRYGRLIWSPDGTTLAHIVADRDSEYTGRPGQVTVADHMGWRHLGDGEREGTRHQLHLLTLATGEDEALPTPDLDVREVAWSPDGRQLVISAKRTADLGRTLNLDLFTLGRDGSGLRHLPVGPGPDHHPVWFEAERLALQSHPDSLHESEPSQLLVCDATTGAVQHRYLQDFDNCVWGIWEHDGRFYARGARRGTAAIFAVDDAGVRQLSPDGWNCWDIRFGGDRAVFWAHSFMSPGRLFTLDLDTGEVATLVDPNQRWCEVVQLVEPQSFSVTVDGRALDAWVFLPPDRRPGERPPAVLSIHGGPEWMYGGYFLPEFHVLPSFGYTVVAANPTGSTGYGREFMDDIRGDWTGRPAREVLAVLDHAVDAGWADPDLLAVMGGSYGGHLAAALTTQTGVFRAAACDRMYPQTEMFWGATDEKWFPEWEFGGRPFDPGAREIYRRNDPFTQVARVTTPTLLSHGLRDFRCPQDGTMAWFSALQSLGVPSRYLRFHHEGHGIRGVANQMFYLDQLLLWFEAHVLESHSP